MINQVRLISIEQEYEVELDRLKKMNSFLVVDLHPSSRKVTFLFPRKDSLRVDAFHRAHWKSFFFISQLSTITTAKCIRKRALSCC